MAAEWEWEPPQMKWAMATARPQEQGLSDPLPQWEDSDKNDQWVATKVETEKKCLDDGPSLWHTTTWKLPTGHNNTVHAR